MKNFQFLATFDQVPLMHQVQLHPALWNQNTLRTTHPGTPHTEVDDIWLRFNDLTPYKDKPLAEYGGILDEHESIWYPAIDALPAARGLILWLMARVGGIRLGRCLITKLAPGEKVAPHIDGGSHAAYYERYHLILQGLPGNVFRCGTEQVDMLTGQIWWFQNGIEHEAVNNSADDRIHLIVDVKL